jgi:hypothetical protein
MARKLVWNEEKAFHGWACDQCGFVLPNPRLLDSMDDYVPQARKAFEAHNCAANPLRREANDSAKNKGLE